MEILYCVNGATEIQYYPFDSNEKCSVIVYPHQFLLMRSNLRHSQCAQTDTHALVLQLGPSTLKQSPLETTLPKSRFVSSLPRAAKLLEGWKDILLLDDIATVKITLDSVIQLIYRHFIGTCDPDTACAEYELGLKSLLLEICRCYANKSPQPGYNRFIANAVNLINLHYHRIGVQEIAGRLGLSIGYLSELFKKSTGKTLHEFLIEIRLKKAKELLAQSEINVKTIATKVGYKSLRSFEIAFSKRYGCSPLAYKKTCAPVQISIWENEGIGYHEIIPQTINSNLLIKQTQKTTP